MRDITLEGPEETRRIIIVEFSTFEKAKEFYNSIEYQEIKLLRKDYAVDELIVVGDIK